MTAFFLTILSAAIGTGVALSVGLLAMVAAAHFVDRYPSLSEDDDG